MAMTNGNLNVAIPLADAAHKYNISEVVQLPMVQEW
jgi:hypothetical protein